MKQVQKLSMTGLFMALALVLPFLTAQIPQLGTAFLPMHYPVILCGLVCGWKYGLICGLVSPVLRSLLFGMPPFFPTAVAMSVELAVYGGLAGFLYEKIPYKCIYAAFLSMLAGMIAGRIAWSLVMLILLGLTGQSMPVGYFVSAVFVESLPGIVLQLILVPAVLTLLGKARLIPWSKSRAVPGRN